ncbi:MAG: MarR family transcriptional regulator [Acidobacteria bacterium]|nr:MAG: MarR family transcriptional regulator [Acidobacteriota bacterium]
MRPVGIDRHVDNVRRFNRFYTRQIGVLNGGFLQSSFSLTEVRVLYEIAHRERTAASELIRELGIDAGYLSRILRAFHRKGLVAKRTSSDDRRQIDLTLTVKGRREFGKLEMRQRVEVARMLQPLGPKHRLRLLHAMGSIERLLLQPIRRPTVTLRDHRPGDMGWITHRQAILYNQEYGWNTEYEALIAEIMARFLRNFDPRYERCWVAECNCEIVGSVFCVRKSKTVAQLRLLYVEPSTRGAGIGSRLVNECIGFARARGYRKLTLWTNSVLHAARKIYERAGFQLVAEEKHHSFGKDLVGQNWDLKL